MLTAALAWMVFRENAGARVMVGMAAIAAGALILSWQKGPRLDDARPAAHSRRHPHYPDAHHRHEH